MPSICLKAGASSCDITPPDSHFLFGYPYVERMSTGTHDPLLSSALYLSDGATEVLFISNDVIYVSKESVARIRKVISQKTGIHEQHVLIAATHTHSGPVTVDVAISAHDPVVPRADRKYLQYMEERTTAAALDACGKAEPVEISFVRGDATGIGSNRHNPAMAKDMDVPVMVVRNLKKEFIGSLLVCSMHPTVLHEDSTLYSSDFPHYVRETLRQEFLGEKCTVVYFTGTAGDQSPRHVTKANTFEEARRIGKIVASSVIEKLSAPFSYSSCVPVYAARELVDLPKRQFPEVEWALQNRDRTKKRYESLRKNSDISQEIRTAEVDWFGSEELLYLSGLAQSGSMDSVYESCQPAEIMMIRVGEWAFISWPGEIFAEYGLNLKDQFDTVALITCANGELQGYIPTEEAFEKGFYEAGNSLFDSGAGIIMSEKSISLLNKTGQ